VVIRSRDMVRLLYIAFGAIASSACERGCLSKGFQKDTAMSALSVTQDCPTGMARCVSGAIEVTTGQSSCSGCPCAWKRLEVCANGCALETVELVREPDVAGSLCKRVSDSSALPLVDAGSTYCPSEGRFICRDGSVYACPQPSGLAVPVAVCTLGCAQEEETLESPGVDIGTATSVMCATRDRFHDSGILAP